jgi:hypothetical protein
MMIAKGFVLAVVISSALTLTSGCAVNRATAVVSPDADMSKIKTFYVVKGPSDGRGIELLIRDNLGKRGFGATAGPELPQGSYQSDAVVSYVDKWMWDMTMYMLELTITVRNPTSNYPMATGNSYHTSLTRKTPAEMVEEVLSNIFNSGKEKK